MAGFFKKLFAGKPSEPDPQDACWDFCEAHDKELKKMESQIWRCIKYDAHPDKIKQGFEAAFALCDQYKEFCFSHGIGGQEYYNIEGKDILADVQEDYNSFLQEYDERLSDWNEREADLAKRKAVKATLRNAIKKEGKISQTDLKKVLPLEDASYYPASIKALESEGKILRVKENGRVFFQHKK